MKPGLYHIQIVAVIGSVGLLLWVLHLIRGGKLKERYSVLWFVAAAWLFLFAVWRHLIDILGRFFGIDYAPSLLFLSALVLGVLLFMHFSLVISEHSRKITRLTQEIGLLRRELARRDQPEENPTSAPSPPHNPDQGQDPSPPSRA